MSLKTQKKQAYLTAPTFEDVLLYRFAVRLNKKTNKYELFECIRKPKSKYQLRDVLINNPKIFIDFNKLIDLKKGVYEEFKNIEKQETYGPTNRMFCFVNENFDSLDLNFPHTAENIGKFIYKCSIQDFLNLVEKVNEKQTKYSVQKKLNISKQKVSESLEPQETKTSDRVC